VSRQSSVTSVAETSFSNFGEFAVISPLVSVLHRQGHSCISFRTISASSRCASEAVKPICDVSSIQHPNTPTPNTRPQPHKVISHLPCNRTQPAQHNLSDSTETNRQFKLLQCHSRTAPCTAPPVVPVRLPRHPMI
jgi:hypothetical protein